MKTNVRFYPFGPGQTCVPIPTSTFGRMMDIYYLGGKPWLICGPKEANLNNIPLWGPLRGPQKSVLDSCCFLWAANQPGFFTQAVNIHYPTECRGRNWNVCSLWELHPHCTTHGILNLGRVDIDLGDHGGRCTLSPKEWV